MRGQLKDNQLQKFLVEFSDDSLCSKARDVVLTEGHTLWPVGRSDRLVMTKSAYSLLRKSGIDCTVIDSNV